MRGLPGRRQAPPWMIPDSGAPEERRPSGCSLQSNAFGASLKYCRAPSASSRRRCSAGQTPRVGGGAHRHSRLLSARRVPSPASPAGLLQAWRSGRARTPLALTSSLSKQCPRAAMAQRRRGGPGQPGPGSLAHEAAATRSEAVGSLKTSGLHAVSRRSVVTNLAGLRRPVTADGRWELTPCPSKNPSAARRPAALRCAGAMGSLAPPLRRSLYIQTKYQERPGLSAPRVR